MFRMNGKREWTARRARLLPGADLLVPGVVAVGGLVGLVLGYLVLDGLWYIAAVMVAALPALILIHRHPFLAVLIWLLVTPFLLHTETDTLRYVYWAVHRGLPPLALGIIVLSDGLQMRRRPLARLGPAEVAMAGYVLASVTSIAFQNGNPQAMFYLFYDRIIVAMCLYMIIRLSEPTDAEMRWLLGAAAFIVLTQSAVGVLSQFAPGVLPSSWMENAGARTVGTLINPAIYTIALMFGALILIHAAQYAHSRWQRVLFALCFLLAFYCTFISFSRASWLAGAMVGALVFVAYPRFTLKLAAVVLPLGLLAGGVMLADQIAWARERIYSAEAENSANSRLPIMVGAYNMFLEKPVAGWGYGNFDLYDRSFYGALLGSTGDNRDHASHNYFLTILAEQGLLGLSLYLFPMFYWLFRSARRYRDMPKSGLRSRKLLWMLWLVILFHIIVSNFINMIVVYGLGIWWITLGLIGYLVEDDGLREAARRPAVASRPGEIQIFGGGA